MADGGELPRARNPTADGAAGAAGALAPAEKVQTDGAGSKRKGIQMWLSGADPADYVNGRAQHKKKAPEERIVTIGGENVTVFKDFKGTHAAEDERWILILAVKDNGTKTYKCVRCGFVRTCKIGVMINHCMRIAGEGAKLCTKTPTTEMTDALSRFVCCLVGDLRDRVSVSVNEHWQS